MVAKKMIDKTGKRFGKLLVLRLGAGKKGRRYWLCRCDCGYEWEVLSGKLIDGQGVTCTKSCQKCKYTGHSTTHGMYGTPEYKSWEGMISRCKHSHNYVIKGIAVCKEWMKSFQAFYNHIGPRPGLEYSVDRINNDGNYEPGNVRWATAKEQSNNTDRNLMIEYGGVTQTLKQWSEELNINYSTLKNRIIRNNWDAHRAFTQPINKNMNKYNKNK